MILESLNKIYEEKECTDNKYASIFCTHRANNANDQLIYDSTTDICKCSRCLTTFKVPKPEDFEQNKITDDFDKCCELFKSYLEFAKIATNYNDEEAVNRLYCMMLFIVDLYKEFKNNIMKCIMEYNKK